MAFKLKGGFRPITGAIKASNTFVPDPYFYFTQFDSSTTTDGGSYNAEYTQVSALAIGSYETFRPQNPTVEVRLRWNTSNWANSMYVIMEGVGTIFRWYSNGDILYWTDRDGVSQSAGGYTQSAINEMRYDLVNGIMKWYNNGVQQGADIAVKIYTAEDALNCYAKSIEHSQTKSTITLYPEA